MKQILLSLTGAAVGFLAAWLALSPRQPTGPAPAASIEPAREASPAPAQPKPRKTGESASVAVERAQSAAAEILEKLKTLRVLSGAKRAASTRLIIHQLALLAEQGPAALPPIREFLGKFEDVDYLSDLSREEDAEDATADRSNPWGRSLGSASRRPPRLDSIAPPSLRLGLIDVLKDIGGDGAEQILAEVLTGSGRGVEVAYAARALHELAPDKHREAAIAAARDLLANPPKLDRPNRLDENAKIFLYSLLELYGDSAIAANAPNLVITPEGQLDRTALTHLASSLKDQAVPALYQAYKDARLTNISDRAILASQILTHAGLNQQANDAFREMVFDEKLPPWMRTLTIQSLAGGRGPISTSMPVEPAQIQARIDILNSLPDLGDERMTRARAEAVERLNNRLSTVSQAAETARTFKDRSGPEAPPPLPPASAPPLP